MTGGERSPNPGPDRSTEQKRRVRTVAALWQSNGLTVVYGPNSVGKTSLLNDVISQYDKDGVDMLPVGRVSGLWIPDSNPHVATLIATWSQSPQTQPTNANELSIKDFLATRPVRLDRYGDPLPVMAPIDQFEKLYYGSLPRSQGMYDDFIDQLADASREDPSLRLLVAIRDEAIAGLLGDETRIAGHSRSRFRVLPLPSNEDSNNARTEATPE